MIAAFIGCFIRLIILIQVVFFKFVYCPDDRLVVITVVAVFGALRTCAMGAHHSRMLTQSVLLAERLLTETRLQQNPAYEETQGVEGLYHWTVRVVPTPVETLAAIRVQVSWPEQGRSQQYDLVSFGAMKSLTERHE